ncbi:MAG: hypothetical protein ACXAAM_07280 [Candidatus Heimdallarchaeaceae archaeon]|jgi:hypothetical protein
MYTSSKIKENSFSIAGFINLGSVVIAALISMIFLYLLFYGDLAFGSVYKELQATLVIGAVLNIAFLVFFILGMQNLKSRDDIDNTSTISIISIIASLMIFLVLLNTIATLLVLHLTEANWLAIVMGVLTILNGLATFSLYFISWKLFKKLVNHVYIQKLNISFLVLGILFLVSYTLLGLNYFNPLGLASILPLSIFFASIAGLFNIIISVVLILNNGELKQEISKIKET